MINPVGVSGTANVGGEVQVNATMAADIVEINKLLLIPSTTIGTMAQAGVGSNDKGDFLDDIQGLGTGLITKPIKTYEAVSQFWTWKPEEFLARGPYKR